MCNSSHWNRLQLADKKSQSHRWEYGLVGQKLVSLAHFVSVFVSAVAGMGQPGDQLQVVEEQLFDMLLVVAAPGGQFGTVSLPAC